MNYNSHLAPKRYAQYGKDMTVIYDKTSYDSVYELSRALNWSMEHTIDMIRKGAVTYRESREELNNELFNWNDNNG